MLAERAKQSERRLTISDIGRGQYGSDGEPDPRHDGDHVQFPAVDPAVPARLGPMRFGINRVVVVCDYHNDGSNAKLETCSSLAPYF